MTRYIIRRFTFMLIAFFIIVTLTFIFMKLLPGDPFLNPKIPEATRQMLRSYYGLDQPLLQQYIIYLKNLVTGNLGVSMVEKGQHVLDIIISRFPVSAVLGLCSLGFAIITGLSLGIIASLNHNRNWDYIAMVIAIIGISVPNFVFATVLQYVIGVKLRWLPVARWGSVSQIIMPAFALGMSTMAVMARMMRTSMLDVLNQDYITTAKAKGLNKRQITWRHTIRNAILPIVTILGPLLATIITGTFVIEKIFGVPGLGRFYVDTIYNRDYPLIMGTTIFFAALLLLMNFLVDITYGYIDPRIRLLKEKE